MALRTVNELYHFTHATPAHAHHGMYAFFTMMMFGSMYFIMPRILNKEWPSAALISLHFWTTAIGITFYMVELTIGSTFQGIQLNDPENYPNFLEITRNTVPYLFMRSLAGIMIFVGHIAFLVHFIWMLAKKRTTDETSPTLLNTPPRLRAAAAAQ